MSCGPMPVLEITRQPSSRPHRFRYRSEMHGTHGCLTAEDSTTKKKTYPTVVLKNFNANARINIVCSLYQVNDHKGVKVQHSHKLVIKKENQDEDSDPHIKVPTKKSSSTHEAVFSDMGIIHTKRLVFFFLFDFDTNESSARNLIFRFFLFPLSLSLQTKTVRTSKTSCLIK